MFITVLHRIDGETKSDVDYNFTDVNENDYSQMLSLGAVRIILFQVTATRNCPNDNITVSDGIDFKEICRI